MKEFARFLVLLTISFVSAGFVFAQEQHEIDSIKNVNLNLVNQEQLVDNYIAISYLFGGFDTDSSIKYSHAAIDMASESNYREGLSVAYLYAARGLAQKGEMILAFENYQEAMTLFIQLNDSLNLLDCYRGMSYIASYGSSQLKSLEYNLKALALAEALKDTMSLSVIYNNIGTIYRYLDNYESALFYFEKSLSIDSLFNVPKDMAMAYSNLGVLKVEFRRYQEASVDYAHLLQLIPQITNNYVRAYMFLSLAGYYTAVGKYDSSYHFISLASDISVEQKYLHIQTRAYRKMGELKIKQREYKKGIAYLDRCLALSDSIGIKEEFPEIYKLKAQAFSALGSYQKAYDFSQKAIQAIDSLKTKNVASFLEEFEEQKVQNELDRKNLQLALKDQQNANTTMKMRLRLELAIAIIVLLVLLVSIVVYFLLGSRHKNQRLNEQHEIIQQQKELLEKHLKKLEISEESLRKLNAAKDKFFSIIAHDLKSPFNAIIGFSDVLITDYEILDDAQRKEMIDIVGSSAKSTLALLENLLAWARSQSGHLKIVPKPYPLCQLVDDGLMANLSAAQMKNIQLKREIDDGLNVFVDKETVKVVVTNLFNNAVKFSHIGGEIWISGSRNKGMAELCFRDFGIGMNQQILDRLFAIDHDAQRKGTAEETGTGLGLVLCKEFVAQNNGQIRVESVEGQGSVFCISLPLARTSV